MSHVEHKTHNGGLVGLAHAFNLMRKGSVRVGYIKGVSNPQEEETGLTCAQVAAWNTYGTRNADGTEHTPARPFMQEAIKNGQHDFSRLNRINLILCLRGRMDFKRALGQLGAMGARYMKLAIAQSKSWAKPNAPSTIAHKTRGGKVGDQPLKDTGNMQQATTWSVD